MSLSSWFVAGLIGPFFWWVVLGLALWLVRKLKPEWEKILFRDLFS